MTRESDNQPVIARDEVIKTVRLSCLEPEREDIEALTGELNEILGYVQRLEAIDTGSALAKSHVHGEVNVVREDEVKRHMTLEEVASNAPELSGRFFSVPLVIEG
jgi:aspartyl-tRNA(Asn)/glutamyl-tRNA(Gln) amidotransferase subunit C